MERRLNKSPSLSLFLVFPRLEGTAPCLCGIVAESSFITRFLLTIRQLMFSNLFPFLMKPEHFVSPAHTARTFSRSNPEVSNCCRVSCESSKNGGTLSLGICAKRRVVVSSSWCVCVCVCSLFMLSVTWVATARLYCVCSGRCEKNTQCMFGDISVCDGQRVQWTWVESV